MSPSLSNDKHLMVNLYLFKTLYNKIKVKWRYSATGHGKGVVNGFGGSVKGIV